MYIPENCFPYDATFAEAEDFCRSMALRLCRADEINAGNCCSKGCWFDRHYTWFGNTSIPQGNFQNVRDNHNNYSKTNQKLERLQLL